MAEGSSSLLVIILNVSVLKAQKTEINRMKRKKNHVPGMCCL